MQALVACPIPLSRKCNKKRGKRGSGKEKQVLKAPSSAKASTSRVIIKQVSPAKITKYHKQGTFLFPKLF